MTFRSVRVTFENDKHGDATGIEVRNGKLTGSYCTLIYVILNDSLSNILLIILRWENGHEECSQIRIGKQDCRGLFEDNIQNFPRLREIWVNYNLELLPLSDGKMFGIKFINSTQFKRTRNPSNTHFFLQMALLYVHLLLHRLIDRQRTDTRNMQVWPILRTFWYWATSPYIFKIFLVLRP